MCKTDGSPKGFQTKFKELAKIKAEKLTRKNGMQMRVYFCRYCRNWCITRQERKTSPWAGRKNSHKRRKAALRPQICDWENEGGSFRE